LIARLHRLTERGSRSWLFAGFVAVVAIASQTLVHGRLLQPQPAIAGGYAVSAAIGLINSRGLSVRSEEAWGAKRADRDFDLLDLYEPDAPRVISQEPLPGTPLLFFAVGKLTGGLHFRNIVHLLILLHALCAVLLFAALRRSHPLAALLTSLGWAVFLPQFRSTLAPGYDSLDSLVYITALVALRQHHRSQGGVPLLLAGLSCGIGLWIRSYLFVLPLVCVCILAVFKRTRIAGLCLFLIPVLVMAAGLYAVRRPSTGVSHQLIRGGVWHSFWGGIGQFENDRGVIAEDASIREFAEKLAPNQDFRMPNYQYTATYDDTLREAARDYAAEHWPSLVRNTVYRVGWLLFPSFMPSGTLAASKAARLVLVLFGVPISLLAIAGFVVAVRRDRTAALLLAAPWIALLPLTAFYFIAKVPTCAYFVHLAFAAIALEAIANRFWPAPRSLDCAKFSPSGKTKFTPKTW
jgi:hypothetical protein